MSRCRAYLKHLLLDGGLDPGDLVPIQTIAAALGVSRQPVMEAVRLLGAEEFIDVTAQVGCRVVMPVPGELSDFFALFARAEAQIVAHAAERRTAEEALALSNDAAAIDARSVQLIETHYRGPEYRGLNRRLHEQVHAMARTPVASGIVMGLWDRSDFYMRVAFGGVYFTRAVVAGHRAIVAAVVEGRPRAAEDATLEHLRAAGALAVAQLQRQA
ncbi:MAG TPA: GntR family transcriptional regulator [Caulobacteraceae bacterium]